MRLFPALAAMALIYAPAVQAQHEPARHDRSEVKPTPAAKPTPKPAAKPMPHKAAAKGSHADLCKAKYRSYNPRTDRYTVRSGQTRRCTL